MARFAFQHKVGHELHFYRHCSFSFAFFAASAFCVEREIAGCISHLFRQRLFGKQLADFIVGLDVGHRIASRGFAYRILVDELDIFHLPDVAFQRYKFSRAVAGFAVFALECLVEYVAHQRAFSRSAHSCYHGHDIEGETDIDSFEVVFPRSLYFNVIVP